MRIIGGKHRGRRLAEFEGKDIRPTSDRAREALFNILSPKICGARFLDLFCGSGGVGLEALSRGAEEVTFNDISKESLAVLKKNIAAVGEGDKCKVFNLDYSTCLDSCKEQFDIIFIDPPYMQNAGICALEKIAARSLLSENGIAIYERDRAFEGGIAGLIKYDERKYGKAYLTFFKATE